MCGGGGVEMNKEQRTTTTSLQPVSQSVEARYFERFKQRVIHRTTAVAKQHRGTAA